MRDVTVLLPIRTEGIVTTPTLPLSRILGVKEVFPNELLLIGVLPFDAGATVVVSAAFMNGFLCSSTDHLNDGEQDDCTEDSND